MGGRPPWEKTAAAKAGQLLLRQLRAEAAGEVVGKLANHEPKLRPVETPIELMGSWMK